MRVAVLGAGVSGIAAAYRLKELGADAVVYEAAPDWGGLCGSFSVGGFRFDTFAHISFDSGTRAWLEDRTECVVLPPYALNYDAGRWLKHPLQLHLAGLPSEEREKILASFAERDAAAPAPENYGDWLKQAYGAYFAERYPYRYTRKYWTVEPEQMETQWVAGRMAPVTAEQMRRGASDDSLPPSHYAKEARYPRCGGFQTLLSGMAADVEIRTGMRAAAIDPVAGRIAFSNGESAGYDALISTIPLPELCAVIEGVSARVRQAAERLKYTSGVTVSVGLSRKKVSPAAWFYVYDEELLPSRISSPTWFSADNAPDGCGSLQAEVYYSSFRPRSSPLEAVKEVCVRDMIRMGLFEERDVVVTDVREHPYANIIFTEDTYRNRQTVLAFLRDIGIGYAGRFGAWEYLWTGQSLRSGFHAAEDLLQTR